MQSIADVETIESMQQALRNRFPGTRLEFSGRAFQDHAEIWVYVLKGDYKAIDKYCVKHTQYQRQSAFPVWLFAKPWTGTWPGSESETEIRRRREEFLKKMRARLKR